MNKKKYNAFKKIIMLAAPFAVFGCYPSYATPKQTYTQNQNFTKDTVKVLQKLTQNEIDGSFLVSQCIENINNTTLQSRLQAIRNECENNINDLSRLLQKYGGEVPEYSKDFKGYFMNGYAAMRGAFTDQGALKALHTNLKLIFKTFESSLNSPLPQEAKESVKKIYDAKKKALQDLEVLIKETTEK